MSFWISGTVNKSLNSRANFLVSEEAVAAQPEKLFFKMSLSRLSLSIWHVFQILGPSHGFVLFNPDLIV